MNEKIDIKTASKRRQPSDQLLAALLLCTLMLAACGPKAPKIEPPSINITEILIDGDAIQVDVRVDNTVPVPLDAEEISISLQFDQRYRAEQQLPFDLTIPKLGSEYLSLDQLQSSDLQSLINSITDRSSTPYVISTELRLSSGRILNSQREGRISPTPGKPGSYR